MFARDDDATVGPEGSYRRKPVVLCGDVCRRCPRAGRAACRAGESRAERARRKLERVLGPEHPNTLATRHNLAYNTGRAGDAAGARDQLVALLPIFERVLGPEHPDTLTARANLAYWITRASS
jgi:hypothetical protein